MSAVIGPQDVIGFWKEAGPDKWYARNEAFDREIAARFGRLHASVAAGAHADWAATPDGALALIILLDQFSRNLHRDAPEAFAQDELGRKIAADAVDAGFPEKVEPVFRQFFCTPFMHSESLADQAHCVSLSHRLGTADTLKFALIHERIIRRFGRFPHRNGVLGRHTTPAERQFLEGGGFSG
jgi:uncharacterized protein (DUF924 family)